MLLASFSRLALIGATMFSLIGADPNSSSDSNLVEKKDSYHRKSLQERVCQSLKFHLIV